MVVIINGVASIVFKLSENYEFATEILQQSAHLITVYDRTKETSKCLKTMQEKKSAESMSE